MELFHHIQDKYSKYERVEESNQWEIYQLHQKIKEVEIDKVRSTWESQQKIYTLQYELRKINHTYRRTIEKWEEYH